MSKPPGRVEDYTRPFLVMAGLSLFMSLFTLWAVFGYLASLLTGLGVHLAIDRLSRRE